MKQKVNGTELGLAIRNQRKRLGITQAVLAIRLTKRGFDYAGTTIGNWEAGRITIPVGQSNGETILLHALADSLETTPGLLLDEAGWLDIPAAKTDESPRRAKLFNLVSTFSEDEEQLLLDMASHMRTRTA
jgi:transcriptional regulator with XRE-family HTH domain